MKILTLTNMYPTSERPYYGIFVKEQVEELQKQLNPSDVDYLFIDGNNPFKKYIQSIYLLLVKLNNFKPNILHVHFGLTMLPVFFLYPLIKLRRCKIVLTTHGGDVIGHYMLSRWITRLAIYLSDLIICVSIETTEVVKKMNVNYLYLPCGITSLFAPSNLKRSKVVIFPSTTTRFEKNYPLFCAVIQRVKELHKSPFEIAILENLSRKEAAELMQQSACMLMTSNYEGSPQAVKEAILCQLPVISTPAGDVPYLLEKFDKCIVSKDIEELAQGVNYFLENFESGFNYSEELNKSLSNTVICNKILDSYEKLL